MSTVGAAPVALELCICGPFPRVVLTRRPGFKFPQSNDFWRPIEPPRSWTLEKVLSHHRMVVSEPDRGAAKGRLQGPQTAQIKNLIRPIEQKRGFLCLCVLTPSLKLTASDWNFSNKKSAGRANPPDRGRLRRPDSVSHGPHPKAKGATTRSGKTRQGLEADQGRETARRERATAFASIVLPHPGGPYSRTPRGAVSKPLS